MDLNAAYQRLEAHNHTREPNLFLEPEDLEDRLEAIKMKDETGTGISEYVFRCIFVNLKLNGTLYSIITTKDFDGNKKLVVISDKEPPRVDIVLNTNINIDVYMANIAVKDLIEASKQQLTVMANAYLKVHIGEMHAARRARHIGRHLNIALELIDSFAEKVRELGFC